MTPQHVLIVGGGLAGPALALALARHQIRSTIFELRATRSDSGGSLTLAPNALRVLDKCCGVYDRIRAVGYPYTSMGAYSEDGYKFGDISVGDPATEGYEAVRIMRSMIHKVLLDACEDVGHEFVKVKWGARVTQIEDSPEGVDVHLEDGSSTSGEFRPSLNAFSC